MRLKHSYFYTLREEVKDEESVSGNLLVRSAMIKKVSSGVYMYLPLGYKVIKNIEKIIKEEMENISSGELLMPSLIPEDIYMSSKENASHLDIFTLNDRYDKRYVLAPTHERLFMQAASLKIKSYKDLPFSIYQVQDKFRDEEKIRYGLIRIREILMKDAYSFDMDEKGLDNSYNEMYNAYKKIFSRIGINYEIVKSATGSTGGSLSEEFQAITDIGEDKLVICDSCSYKVNSNIAKCTLLTNKSLEEEKTRELVKTPNVGTIDDVSNFLNVSKDKIVKTLIYEIDDSYYAALVKGDNEVNETKLKKLLNANKVSLASFEKVEELTNANIGFAGPIGLSIPVVIDNEVANMTNFVVGANKTDYHYINVNLSDFTFILSADIRNITKDDVCPKCGREINFKNGIEIGNIYKLGTEYSEKLNLTYLDKDNESKFVHMGSYSIGLDRVLAAVVEQNHDDRGIVWPISIAPFKVAIIVVNTNDEKQSDSANYLYEELRKNNISTVLDDRDERVGVKFNDMDLIGIPIRVTIGNKINDGMLEIKQRKKDTFYEVSLYDALAKIEDIIEI